MYEKFYQIKETHKPDEAAQNAIWFHGCRKADAKAIVEGKISAEICVSRPNDPMLFRPFGLLLKGEVTLMGTCDLESGFDYKAYVGDRIIDDDELNYFEREYGIEAIFKAKYEDLEPIWVDGAEGLMTESFLIPKEIIGAMVQEEELVWDETQHFIRWARKNNLKVFIRKANNGEIVEAA